MENNINNEKQIRNKFERIFQYKNNKNAFLDYFYGRTDNCPTLRNDYSCDTEEIFKFYFDKNTSEKDKKAISRYAAAVIKDIYKGDTANIILRLCIGEDLEKVLIESYNNTFERHIHDTKYDKICLNNNDGLKYIQIQVDNFYMFLELENYISKDFNQYLEKVKNNNEILLYKEPHLLLTILVYLINRDDDKILIKQLLNYIDSLKINDAETTSLLFTIADKDEEVYKRLINILNKDNNIIYFLANIELEMRKAGKLYKRLFKGYLEAKQYYYYTNKLIPAYLETCSFPKEYILLSTILNNNALFISGLIFEAKELYDEDKETFYKLYEIIKKLKLEHSYLEYNILYAMLSSIMLTSSDNKYNIDSDYIVAKLKEKCVESLELIIPIKSFDDIISKSIKYIKENRYDNHYSHYLSAIMSFDGINVEASEITAKLLPEYFNCSNDDISFEDRSGKKGPEPEDIKTMIIDGKVMAFIGLERIGGVMMYDVSDPTNPTYVDYLNLRDFSDDISGSVSPEGLCTVSAKDSPTNKPMLIIANEVSGDVNVVEVAGETYQHSLTLDKTEIALKPGENQTLNVTYDGYKTLTFSSDNNNVVSINNNVITAINPGVATITVSDGQIQATCKVTVTNPDNSQTGTQTPSTPDQNVSSQEKQPANTAVKTGDESNLGLYTAVSFLAIGLIIELVRRRQKSH